LRHDGRGARLLARQVEEARRRRRDHDRQQPRSTRLPPTSTSATRSSARPT
jgi:hypothetical protein